MSQFPDREDEVLGSFGDSGDGPAVPRKKISKGHPSGLWVLFITEMWERFSYYGMRALLVLYLVATTSEWNAGFGWSEESAVKLYGWYTGLVYLTPIFGGWIADKFLGTHRSMLVGGWIIAAGHFCLAFTEFFGHGAAGSITLGSAPAPFLTFMTGLVLIIIGTGFFKPCVSVMVGQLYSEDDPRRDSGFTIFYMGINVGAFLSGVVAGTLGEKVGWHWGFGSAGVGMIAGLMVYQFFRPMFLKGIGLPPHHAPEHNSHKDPTPEQIQQAEQDEYERTRPLTRVDWDRMAVIVILAGFAIAFWVAFEQAGSSLNLFAMNRTDRVVAGQEFPATWYQSVNPAAIVLFAPLFAWLWLWLDKRGLQPSTPVKFAIGLMILGLGYLVMIFAALQADAAGKAGPHWLLLMYTMVTWGELCLSPVGLSMVTKLSPARYTSQMMGLYFASYFVSNLTAGYLAAFSSKVAAGEVFTLIGGQADFFLFLFAMPLVVGIIVLTLSPAIKKMMHGLH
jgi:proton-dependent oligopeptide transporter, POT family